MSMQEVGAQMSAQCNDHYGDVGYLREPYYGKPYPTQVLAPEAFRYGRARIAAADLQKRLPDALYLVETREQCFGNEAAVECGGAILARDRTPCDKEFVISLS